ncbi:4-hydroxybutyrate CoA-transferase [Desulfocarbo indianensis]|nr:4-hydroxybutyrate CoA-transferase [Desulfocarbo indianensis]
MYQDIYRRKLLTPHQAAGLIQEKMTLAHGLTMAEPPALLAAVADRLRAGDLRKLKVFSLLPLKHALETVLAPELSDCVEAISGFVSGGERGLVSVGLNYYMPNHFHQVPRLLTEFLGVDALVTTVSPMDKAGYFSFGTANDYTSTVARSAKLCIVEVNPNMPRVFGDSLLHVSEVTAVVENDEPLLEMPAVDPSPEDEAIGRAVAELVPDGACLQLGFGGLPNAVAGFLEGHRDLGVHTEVFGPGMAQLIKKGIVTGRRKNLHPRKHVFTVAQGDKDMLDFMDDNPAMVSYPVSYTNQPSIIARNEKLISINSIIQVDLLGQCNAEFLAGHQFSGTGGQLDFVRGAFDSPGGKSILAFHSTAKQGTVSRVVPCLDYGAMVTTPRMDAHYLVTEHGAANLKGRSSRERALAIIGLAAPQFRDDLMRQAEDMYLL